MYIFFICTYVCVCVFRIMCAYSGSVGKHKSVMQSYERAESLLLHTTKESLCILR